MRALGLLFLFLLLGAMPVAARAAQVLPTPSDRTTVQQCSACHIAYPAQMLPARSWLALMANLSHHFGEDASVSDRDRATITAYLTAHAADGRAGGRDGRWFLRGLSRSATPLRITDMPWWRRRHGEISPRRFRDARVKTAANCGACHNGQRGFLWGLFDED